MNNNDTYALCNCQLRILSAALTERQQSRRKKLRRKAQTAKNGEEERMTRMQSEYGEKKGKMNAGLTMGGVQE